MRRAFVPKDDSTRITLFTLGLTLGQDADKVGQARKLCVLFGDNLVQLVDGKRQMGDGFFQLGDAILGHGRVIACPATRAQRNPQIRGKL